jgi:diguanylate cyclase (GGDEF)-like protein
MKAAVRRADEWRLLFANELIKRDGAKLQNTFSAGVATYPDHGESMDDLLHAADNALYNAKGMGRNCVFAEDFGHENP